MFFIYFFLSFCNCNLAIKNLNLKLFKYIKILEKFIIFVKIIGQKTIN